LEINDKNPLAVVNPSIRKLDIQRPAQRVNKKGESGSASNADQINLSARSREMQHIYDLIQSTADVRDARVEQIRNEIENGTYNVRGEQIAEKIIVGTLIDEIY
jgi:negative regulator of flagellin synthesis FlgM